jgi:single-strand DNA-binding protein
MSERGINRHEIVGRLGRDPERRVSGSGRVWTRLSIATTEVWKGRDGKEVKRTEWHAAVCWGGAAENAVRYLGTGSRVLISGPSVTWTSADGKKSGKQILVREILFLDGPTHRGTDAGFAPSSGGAGEGALPDAPPEEELDLVGDDETL